jgi:hypothetical protein
MPRRNRRNRDVRNEIDYPAIIRLVAFQVGVRTAGTPQTHDPEMTQ